VTKRVLEIPPTPVSRSPSSPVAYVVVSPVRRTGAAGLVVVGQLLEGPERLLVEGLALDHHPLLEGGAVQGKAVEEVAAVEVDGCLQPPDTGGAVGQL